MKNTKKILFCVVLIFSLLALMEVHFINSNYSCILAHGSELETSKFDEIDKYVDKQVNQGKIPGVSVVIVEGNKTIYKKGFGYSDIKSKKTVTSDTLFELGSTSKAFTGLAILKLEKEGLINLNDPIEKYIPWLKMKYKGKDVTVTIEQFMHHTSGIPFNSIDKIPAMDSQNSLEETVKKLIGQDLASEPGSKYSYATVNYDVLGLIIEKVTGKPYEEYIKDNLLIPMEMTNTVLNRKDASLKDFSKGYKIGFLKALEYDAPVYKGNTPAGYIITNGTDMEKWLKIQLGTDASAKIDKTLIEKSHIPNKTVIQNGDGSLYAYGWFVNENNNVDIFHSGNNPNYSSSILLDSKENIGVSVLANMNSAYTDAISQGIMNILLGKENKNQTSDTYKNIDEIASMAFYIISFLLVIILYIFIKSVINLFRDKKSFNLVGIKRKVGFIISLCLISVFEYGLIFLPNIFVQGLSWGFLYVWAPITLILADFSLIVFSILLYLSIFFKVFFKKRIA